ncbi:hypothetical protein X953_01705 [Virgibacillus sp. SK37]|nr:hypothetical protein X953_01705 [Virgibacillus sp. SK37]
MIQVSMSGWMKKKHWVSAYNMQRNWFICEPS